MHKGSEMKVLACLSKGESDQNGMSNGENGKRWGEKVAGRHLYSK